MTLLSPPPLRPKWLQISWKTFTKVLEQIQEQFLLNSIFQIELVGLAILWFFFFFVKKNYTFLKLVPIPGENGGRAPENIPHPLPGSNSATNASAAPRLPPRLHFPRNALIPGARGGSDPACDPWAPTRNGGQCGVAQTLQSSWQNSDPLRTPAGRAAPGFAGLGAFDPQRGGQGPRFQPKAGKKAESKGRQAAGAWGLRRAAGPSPGSESPTPFFHRESSLLLARGHGSLACHGAGARRTPAAAQPARCAGSSGGPGEGRTRRPGQGERAAPPTWCRYARPRGSDHRPKLHDRGTSFCRRCKRGLQMGAARDGCQCGGAGLPPAAEGGSGAVRLGFAREKGEGAVPAQPPAGTPRYARGMFAGFIPGYSL